MQTLHRADFGGTSSCCVSVFALGIWITDRHNGRRTGAPKFLASSRSGAYFENNHQLAYGVSYSDDALIQGYWPTIR
jgi:hypothetical protein